MEWREGEVPGTSYGLSNKGWVDTKLFRGWLTDHFLEHAVSVRSLLVLLDGHNSHFQPDLIRFVRSMTSFCFAFLPIQPMRVSLLTPVFSSH